LEVLRKKNVKATFFVVGDMVRRYPSVLRRVAEEGHVIANHSYSHPFKRLTYEGYLNELDQTALVVQRSVGVKTALFRPPYNRVNEPLLAACRARGYLLILWSVDPADYRKVPSDRLVLRVLNSAKAGSIILLHDGGPVRQNTVKALPKIIDELRARGFRLVTVPELLQLPTHQVPLGAQGSAIERAEAFRASRAVRRATPRAPTND